MQALRDIGASVSDVSATPCGFDTVVGFRGRNYVLEIKDGSKRPSCRKLTDIERAVMESWRGQYSVVTSAEEAVAAVKVFLNGYSGKEAGNSGD